MASAKREPITGGWGGTPRAESTAGSRGRAPGQEATSGGANCFK